MPIFFNNAANKSVSHEECSSNITCSSCMINGNHIQK